MGKETKRPIFSVDAVLRYRASLLLALLAPLLTLAKAFLVFWHVTRTEYKMMPEPGTGKSLHWHRFHFFFLPFPNLQ